MIEIGVKKGGVMLRGKKAGKRCSWPYVGDELMVGLAGQREVGR
jgi:hypothetical protein